MSYVDDKFRRWMALTVSDVTDRGAVSVLSLEHAVEGEGGTPIERFTLAGEDPEEIAQKVWDRAEEYAESFIRGRRQRFVVLAFRSDENGDPFQEHDSLFSFALYGRGNTGDTYSEDSYPATPQGEAGQRLAHQAELHRILVRSHETLIPRLERMLERESARANHLESKAYDLLKIREELLDRQEDRRLNSAREIESARRTSELIGLGITMLPLVVAKLMGAGGGVGKDGGASSIRDAAIGKFLKEMSQDEFMGVLNALNPQKRLAMLELYKSYAEDEKKEQEKKPEALRDEPPRAEEPNVVPIEKKRKT